ncbi:MAG: hypothetical protein ACEPOZ_16295 [Marinifilaceae bacterium]
MEFKKIAGFILMALAVVTFFLYLLFPFISHSSKIILITVSLYVANKIFFYSALYILGKQFIRKIGKYLPRKVEQLLLRFLKVPPVEVVPA